MTIDIVALLQSLDLMWKGMLAIFAVILVIFLAVNLMHRLGSRKNNGQ